MTDQLELEVEVEDIVEDIPSELDTLKARATTMGIKFHPSIGVDKLREKVNGSLEEKNVTTKLNENSTDFLTHDQYSKLQFKGRKKKAASLIRINVMNMNPNKKDWEGEIISVGSAKLGTFKKYVPFNTDDGWHVPHIIYEAMKERKCSVFNTVKDHLGNKVRKAKQIPEFNIQVLPHLTKDELKDLAQRQALAGSIDS